MVSFYCSQCNDTIKKKKAEVHLYKCRSAVLSCVDCGKEFRGNSYAAHTTCVSEAQKYEKPGTQFDLPKGDKKQLDWFKTVQNAILSKKGSPKCCELLQRLQDFPNTPRKQAKFMNFVMNSLHGFRTEHVEEAWVIISECASEVQGKANGDAEPEKVEPQSTGNAANGEATDINEKKKKKKHSKVEQQEETTDQVSSVSCDADADERKRKKHKRKHEAQQAEDSLEQPLDSGQNCVVAEGLANGFDTIKKKKKKHSVDAAIESSNIEEACANGDEKKHKNGADNTVCAAETSCNGSAAATPDKAEKKKKKKHSNGCTNEQEEAVMMNGVNSTNGKNGHAKELELDASVSVEEPRKHKKHKRHHTTEESSELPLTNGKKKKKRRDTETDESSSRIENTEKETEPNCVDGQLNGKKKKHKKRSESNVADNHHNSSSPNLTTSRC